MYTLIQFPLIENYKNGFPIYWQKRVFQGSPSQNTHINALTHTYMRLVEVALAEYKLGGEKHQEFWDRKESFAYGSINRSVSHFENCITAIYRAIECFKQLRNHKTNDPLSLHLRIDAKPAFTKYIVCQRISEVRNAIHHLDQLLLRGQIEEGKPIALRPEGFEIEHPSEPNQTIKTFDRLSISNYEISFNELAEWLMEMANQAEKIALFDKPQ